MTIKVHIIDASKASLVMSSEVFKDKIPGSIVSYSLTAKEGLAHLQSRADQDTPTAVVVDFNLPDADGVTLTKELRKFYNGPIFITAHPDKIIDLAVNEELFFYHDACCWIPKPVRFDVLEKRIEQFVINRHRILKRFDVNYPTLLTGKGEGRGKRAPKFDGRLINISIGGVCMAVNNPGKLRRDEEFIVTLGVPSGSLQGATAVAVLKPVINAVKQGLSAAAKQAVAFAKRSDKPVANLSVAAKKKALSNKKLKGRAADSGRSGASAAQVEQVAAPAQNPFGDLDLKNLQEYKIKATVAWCSDGGRMVGLKFAKIPESQRKNLESFLKGLSA
jgi:CheY-like chemotaxis protein